MDQGNTEYWDALALVAQANDVGSYTHAIKAMLHAVDFGGVYVLAPIVADPRVDRNLWSVGFPQQWVGDYKSRYKLADPLPTIALNRPSAFRWSEAEELADLSDYQSEYLRYMQSHSMGEGVAVYCTGPNARSGFVGIGLPQSNQPISDSHLRKIQVAAQLCFQRYCGLLSFLGHTTPDLSQRELDVIRWIGEGKSNAVIADILDISKSTVDSYVKRIFAKLGVSDRTTAAIRAVALGLIASGKPDDTQAESLGWRE